MQTNSFTNNLLNENYSLTVLDNGLKIFICKKPQFDSYYAVFGTKYGSIDTAFAKKGEEITEVPEGIAHFLEHKLFESEDGDAFSKYAKTGANANAYTSFDRTCYLFGCSDKFDENLEILLDFVQNPYFTQATVDKEQGIIGQEITMYDDSPGWCVFFNMLEAMYHINPVRIDIAGTKESIAKIDAQLLHKCYNTFYNPANMFVCVVGNVKTQDIINTVKSKIKPCEYFEIERKKFDEPYDVLNSYTEKALDVAMPIFNFGYKFPADEKFSLKDTVCINLLLNTLANDTTPLYNRLTEQGLINDEFDTEHFYGRGFNAAIFSGESVNPEAVVKEIHLEINNAKQNGLNEQIFEAARRTLYGSAVKRFNSVENIASMLVDAAVFDYNAFDEIEIIKNLKVSDLEEYLNLFDATKTVLSVINPVKEV